MAPRSDSTAEISSGESWSARPESGERSRAHGALASASRTRILNLLRNSTTPLEVEHIARYSSLHPNTVRFHLSVLVDAGLGCYRTDPQGGAGRRRLVYAPTTAGCGS